MELNSKLDGIVIEATFSVKRSESAPTIGNCKAKFLFDGIMLKDALERWARKSLVIDLQRVARGLTDKEIRETFVDNTYTCNAQNAGKKLVSAEEQKNAAKAALKAMSAEERAALIKELMGE